MREVALSSTASRPTVDGIKHWLRARIAASTRLEPHEILVDAPFASYGVDSVLALLTAVYFTHEFFDLPPP